MIDYAGFLLISVSIGIKHKLQVMQNDALRFCKGIKLQDKVSIPVLFHQPYHQRAEKVNFRAETVVLLPGTSFGQ